MIGMLLIALSDLFFQFIHFQFHFVVNICNYTTVYIMRKRWTNTSWVTEVHLSPVTVKGLSVWFAWDKEKTHNI